MRPWFERDPGLLDRELAALEELGAAIEVDEGARAAGVLRLLIDYPSPSGVLHLIGIYPDLYPFFRPEVLAPDLTLPRHQQPIGKALCLIGRRTSRWFAQDTMATLLRDQLPHLLPMIAGEPTDSVGLVEEPQGEPVSDYYNSQAPLESYLLFDGAWSIDPAVERGTFVARVRRVSVADELSMTFQGYVTEVQSLDGRVLAEWTGPRLPGLEEEINGRWLRQGQPVLGGINEVLESLGDDRGWLKNDSNWPPQRHLSLSALLFPEEVGHRLYADGWAAIQWSVSRRRRGEPRLIAGNFLRTARAGTSDLAARMPATVSLQERSVAIFGVGAIGAPAALEFARAGVGRLLLVDHDQVDPSTVRRWPFGASAFGRRKVDVLMERISAEYPWTTVETDTMRVGSVDEVSDGERQGARLDRLLAGRDLIIDCTAELGVNHLLSELARVRGIPYLLANATPGGWGGMVASFTGEGACWLCLRHALYADRSIPLPPADPAGELQPAGCADPTFTGNAFDLTELSLELVRASAGLLGDHLGGYPKPEWQLAILHLRAPDGRRIAPCWRGLAVPSRADCGCSH